MRNIYLVARREFLTHIRNRSFLFTAFGIPAIIAVLVTLVGVFTFDAVDGEVADASIGYVDVAAILSDTTEAPTAFIAFEDEDSALAALEAEAIDLYVVVPANYMRLGRVQAYASGGVTEPQEDAIEDLLTLALVSEVETDLPLEILQDPVDSTLFLENNQREVTESAIIGLLFLPLIFALVFFMALQISATFLMGSIIDEKSNRIMEILITSITPFELLTGKLIGSGLLGLVQLFAWLGVGYATQTLGSQIEIFSAVSIPVDLVLIAILYFFLAYFLFGSIMAGIGSVVNGEQESRQIAGFISLIPLAPFFLLGSLLDEPSSSLAVFLTVFPFTAPVTTIFRVGLDSVPLWQMGASIGLMVVITIVMMWISGRIFRWALLLYGKPIGPRTVWQVIRSGAEMGVMPSETRKQEVQS